MLNQLRKTTGSWVAKLLLVLLVASFAVWGISGEILGTGRGNVVTAGDTAVTPVEYRLAYDRQINVLSQQFGTRLTREQAQAFGVDNQVLAQLVAGAVLDEQAREMGLGLSRDRLAALTAEDPAFQGTDGRFDRAQFDWVLRQVGMRPEDYLRNRQQVAIRQQVIDAVAEGLVVPDAFLSAVALFEGETRTVEHIVLPRSAVEPLGEPSAEELAAFFEERTADYRAPEYRSLSYIKLEPEDIADPAAVTDEQARAYYEEFRTRFSTGERRTIDQLVFPDAEAAEAARERLDDGDVTFEDIVEEAGRSMSDVRLGTFDRESLPDANVADAAFALEEGAVSEVVRGTFGPVLLRVAAIEEEAIQPFEAVRDEIAQDLAIDEATRILMDVYDGYEDGRAAGLTMQEAAEAQQLQVVTVEAIDSQGRTPQGESPLDGLPEASTLLQEAFDADAGVENPAINIGSIGYLFYEVEEITPARDRPLDEVRDEALSDWRQSETVRRLSARASEMEQALRDGGDFAAIAEEAGLQVETRRGLRRDTSDSTFADSGVAAVFSVAQGETGVSPAGDGTSQIVFRVSEVFEPAGAGPDAVAQNVKDGFSGALADDLLDQLVARLQSQYTVRVDQNAMRQALSF